MDDRGKKDWMIEAIWTHGISLVEKGHVSNEVGIFESYLADGISNKYVYRLKKDSYSALKQFRPDLFHYGHVCV